MYCIDGETESRGIGSLRPQTQSGEITMSRQVRGTHRKVFEPGRGLHFQTHYGVPVALWYGDEYVGDIQAIRAGDPSIQTGQMDVFGGFSRWRYSHWAVPPEVGR